MLHGKEINIKNTKTYLHQFPKGSNGFVPAALLRTNLWRLMTMI